jgi:hypothetical protein
MAHRGNPVSSFYFYTMDPVSNLQQVYTESLVPAAILYIHIDRLHQLYKGSHEWERFGRILAELAFAASMKSTEGFLLHTAEERYLQMITDHPTIFNSVPLYHIASYLGIQGPSLSRIRKRIHPRQG